MKKDLRTETTRYLKSKEKENISYPNQWDSAKAVQRKRLQLEIPLVLKNKIIPK